MDKELELARESMETSGRAILSAAARLSDSFLSAVSLIAGHGGKTVFTGVGKSGRIAEKLAATFSSTGTPSVFLHAGEALHGDSGVVSPGDPLIAISKSGASPELLRLISVLGLSPVVAITGNLDSSLARAARFVLDARVGAECDPYNMVPSASSSVALALGHSLAIAVMSRKGFNPSRFAGQHPDGELGRLLTRTVRGTMLYSPSVARVTADHQLRAVLIEMTRWPTGAACVLNAEGLLEGLITDGDIRRCLEKFPDIRPVVASDVMTRAPVTIGPEATLFDAVQVMENGPRQLLVLPVVEAGRLLGVLRLHDVVRAQAG